MVAQWSDMPEVIGSSPIATTKRSKWYVTLENEASYRLNITYIGNRKHTYMSNRW